MNRQSSLQQNLLRRFVVSVAPWGISLLVISCGTESAAPLSANSDQGSTAAGAGTSAPGSGVLSAGEDAEHTLGSALGSVGKESSGDDRTGLLTADQEPTPEQKRLEAMEALVHLSPGDHTGLNEALREPDPAIQLVALDRLGEMAQWDAEARRTLEDFRNHEGNAGLQRRAADLLSVLSPLPIPAGPVGLSNEAG